MLDFVDETFHQMPLAIEPSIIFSLLFGSLMWWNHDFYASFKQAVHKVLRRIAPIRDNSLKRKAFHQALGLAYVVSLSRTQAETQGITQTVHRNMDFAAKTTATAPQSLLLTFFGRRRHRDALEQSYCQLARFPYPGHRQGLPSCVSKPLLSPSEKIGRKPNSIFRIRLAANAIARRCGLSISSPQGIGGIWPHCPNKHLGLPSGNPEFSPTARQLVLCLS